MENNVTPIRPVDRILGIEELSDKLGVAVQTLYRWRSEGQDMPAAFKIGRKLCWKESVVDAWIDVQAEVAA